MSGVNKVILVGRLGNHPEIRQLDNGTKVANFSLATSEVYKDRNTGEKKEESEWHRIVLWKEKAELAEKYLSKGDMVYVEGKLKTRSWEKEGVTHYTTEIVGTNITFLGKSGQPNSQPSTNTTQDTIVDVPEKMDEDVTDDLPF